jgi:ribosomal protein S18 acetylase RimI-like enzyme
MISLQKAEHKTNYIFIEKLAKEILHEVYDPIIPSEHTDYFISKYQTAKVIEEQIADKNFTYYLLNFNTEVVGYLGVQKLDTKLILSKLYVLQSFRGKKIGKTAMEFVFEYAKDNKIKTIELIANQQNPNAIEMYKKYGFEIVESMINTFPSGYTIKDYKLEKVFIK